MGVTWVAKLAWAGACSVLLASCGRTEHDLSTPFQPAASAGAAGGGSSAVGGSSNGAGGNFAGSGTAGAPAAFSGAAGSGGSAGAPVEPGCRGDMYPAAAPTPIPGKTIDMVASDGCGRDYLCAANVKRVISTRGTKAADCADQLNGVPQCGPWSVERSYWVTVPAGYDPNKYYPLVIQAPGCGGNGMNVIDIDHNVSQSVIRVGISPGPSSTGSPTGASEGCFDSREGDDSIDWEFYERLYDKLNDEYCFDRRRVFVSGERNGGTFANELGCKYAEDALRPVRGVLVYDGDFPAEPQAIPTCSLAGLAGMWIQDATSVDERAEPFKRAVTRAMQVAHCTDQDYDHAQLETFPIGGGQPDGTCQRILGCDPIFPLVVCPIANSSQSNNQQIQNPGFATFIKSFNYPPLSD